MTSLLLLWSALGWGACPQPEAELRSAALDRAQRAVLLLNVDRADAAIEKVEEAFSCGGLATQDQLARTWILEGALRHILGDADAARAAFRAAAEIDPEVWIDDLGSELRTLYLAAEEEEVGSATIRLDPKPEGWVTALDGVLTPFPATAPPGLHLVQMGPRQDDTRLARIVSLVKGETQVLTTDEVADQVVPTPKPVAEHKVPDSAAPPATMPEPDKAVRLGLTLAAGADLAIGQAWAPATAPREPGVKLSLPVEVGAQLAAEAWWARTVVSAAPLLAGQYVYTVEDEVRSSIAGLGGHVAGGPRLGSIEVGLSAGLAWPARVPFRAIFSIPTGPVRIEGRLGVSAAVQRPMEPAASLLLCWRP